MFVLPALPQVKYFLVLLISFIDTQSFSLTENTEPGRKIRLCKGDFLFFLKNMQFKKISLFLLAIKTSRHYKDYRLKTFLTCLDKFFYFDIFRSSVILDILRIYKLRICNQTLLIYYRGKLIRMENFFKMALAS